MGILRFIFTLLAIWFVIRLLARLFLPLIIQKLVQKAGNQINRDFRETQPRKPEGTIEVNYESKQKASVKKATEGEFVDFEEIK